MKIEGTYDGNPPFVKPSGITFDDPTAPLGSECIGCTEGGIHIFRRLPSVQKDELSFAE